jgi:hypothetical protein
MQRSHHATQTVLPPSGNRLPQPVAAGNFVINLCSSTTPVALAQLNHAELKKFTFFVSRRREDRRERFRLHMGYFATQEDAEKLLELVREIYPAAWAGVAPGQKLRAAAAAKASALPPLSPAEIELPPVVSTDTQPSPVVAAAVPAVPAVALTPVPAAMPVAIPTAIPVVELVAPPAARAPAKTAKAARSDASDSVKTSARPAKPGKQATTDSLDSVRAAIASLDDRRDVTSDSLSSSQILKVLEIPAGAAVEASAAVTAAPPQAAGYAVQLRFSVKPIPMGEVPQLAIFDAYTLYNAEGNRDGRRWFGLRLGFFSDAASAKQVAHYVRSEFSEVAVVPVSERERNRATSKVEAAKQEQRAHSRLAETIESTGMFKLIEDRPRFEPGAALSLVEEEPAPASAEASAREEAQAGWPAARKPPMTLEETLEVLGANDLKFDTARKELLNATTARLIHHASHRKQPSRSKLAKLFDRLADRFGNL